MKQFSLNSFIDIFLYPDGSFWFLWVLFFINVAFWTGDWMAEKMKVKQEIVVITIGLILVALMVLLDIRVLGFQFIAYYYIFFVFGFYLNKYRRLLTSNTIVLFLLVVLWAVLGWFWKMHESPSFLKVVPLPQTIMQYCYRLLTGLIAVYAILGFGPILLNETKRTTPLESLGRVSLGIYVVHILIMPWIVSLLMKYTANSFVVISLSFLVALLVSWTCVILLGKWKITNRYLLGKI